MAARVAAEGRPRFRVKIGAKVTDERARALAKLHFCLATDDILFEEVEIPHREDGLPFRRRKAGDFAADHLRTSTRDELKAQQSGEQKGFEEHPN